MKKSRFHYLIKDLFWEHSLQLPSDEKLWILRKNFIFLVPPTQMLFVPQGVKTDTKSLGPNLFQTVIRDSGTTMKRDLGLTPEEAGGAASLSLFKEEKH